MVPFSCFLKNISTQRTSPFQWFNISLRLISNSSSSSSSDSDSDSASKTNNAIDNRNKAESTRRTEKNYVAESNLPKSKHSRTIDISIKKSKWQTRNEVLQKYVTRLIRSVQPVQLDSNKSLKKSPATKYSNTYFSQREAVKGITERVSNNTVQENDVKRKLRSEEEMKQIQLDRVNYNKRITEMWKESKRVEKQKSTNEKHPNVIDPMFLHDIKGIQQSEVSESQEKSTAMFTNFPYSSEVCLLPFWKKLETLEINKSLEMYPKNGFEEMITWTEKGILWKFPIDNEQGMEEEQKVHFSEHVFLDRHLENWCPMTGPLRHFMELVCIGLSKNPYMTVQEKYDHIMWYSKYFKENTAILKKLGVIE